MIKVEPAAWMPTASGLKFKFDRLHENFMSIKDIAHSLAFQCRYNGHTRVFYSVAEHCVRVADYLMDQTGVREFAYAGLLHDAAEAYVGDIISPIKRRYFDRTIEDQIELVLAIQFNVPFKLLQSDLIKRADLTLLTTEMRDLFTFDVSAELEEMCKQHPPIPSTIVPMTCEEARLAFLNKFTEYKG